MNGPAMAVEGLTIRYGRMEAVRDVSFAVERGSVYALLGRNGAGKSSLTRCALGHLRADRGRVALFGRDVWRHRAQLMDRIGVVPEESDVPPLMRVDQLGQFCQAVYSRWSRTAFEERLARFSISGRKRVGELSKGQKKQVSLAAALAIEPELLVLDDPTLGLDVVARKSLYEEVIADMADRGTTVFVTTHDLSSVEAIADRVGILVDGRLVLDEEVERLKTRFRRIRFTAVPAALQQSSLAATAVRQWGSGTEAVVSNYDDIAMERFRADAEVTAEVSTMTLEEIFIALTTNEQEVLR